MPGLRWVSRLKERNKAMSKHIGVYYRCDRCGIEDRPEFRHGKDIVQPPKGWEEVGKMHFCGFCWDYASKLVIKEKKEKDSTPILKSNAIREWNKMQDAKKKKGTSQHELP